MNNNRIMLLIQGAPRRAVNFNTGDTLADLVRSLRGDESLRIDKIQKFHVDGEPVSDPSSVRLVPGMLVSGAPKLEGGN
jgi:hypothetical protein